MKVIVDIEGSPDHLHKVLSQTALNCVDPVINQLGFNLQLNNKAVKGSIKIEASLSKQSLDEIALAILRKTWDEDLNNTQNRQVLLRCAAAQITEEFNLEYKVAKALVEQIMEVQMI
jgi:hypothetical protein